ncbi:MAG: S49 family peptidase [Alphaproteobacteria bacterium]|nr:S49 family peptidase [Alphaproteobacteria bacterium]
MSHEITRILRAFSSTAWFIEPRKAEQIVAMLEFRAAHGPRSEPAFPDRPKAAEGSSTVGTIRVLRIHGAILPRTAQLDDISGPGAVSLEAFQKNFREAAADPNTKAIILDVDSPGGQVDLVPETVAMIHAAKRADRPIIAVANTMAASAAYWLASAADELVVTPSGMVGSIGVYMLHEDISKRLEAEGIAPTFIYEGPRKVEGNPFEPLNAEARAALQASVRHYYEMFTKDVAKSRGVPVSVVRADPEATDKHFGGGRVYHAAEAVKLGMADRVATIDDTIRRASGRKARNAGVERRRLALI